MRTAGDQRIGKRDSMPAAIAGSLFITIALASGCAPVAGPVGSPQHAIVSVQQLSPTERAFLNRIAATGLYEGEVSRLAAMRASSPRVRAFAQRLANDHARTNSQLAALMRAKGLEPPAQLAADKATKLHRLSALPPSAEFDRGFVRVVGIEDHTASIALFEQARRDTRDRDLRAWIEGTLPGLRAHLSEAQALSGSLEG